jgi:large subunit ribosomal protein L5
MSTTSSVMTRQRAHETLVKTLAGRNPMALPRLEKIVVSIGVGRSRENSKLTPDALAALKTITGQQPITTRAKKAIAGFKLRLGDVVGTQVTLRGQRMWDFLNRLVMIALPRIRDFRGLKRTSIDARGNYSFGIQEHLVFPEIEEENITITHGLGIVFATTATNKEDGIALLEALGLPLMHTEEK